jgi:hypothetical protein
MDNQISLIRDLLKAEETGRALRTLKTNVPPMRDPGRLSEVTCLFPPTVDGASPHFDCDDEDEWNEEQADELAHSIARRLRRPPRRTRPGILGGRLEHWSVLKVLDGGLARAGKLLSNLGLGLVPEPVIAAHARCEVLAAEKTTGGLRPLQMGSVCRRIAMSAVCSLLRLDVQCAAGPDQLCTGVADGCTKVYHAARTMCRQDVKRGICARDCGSAHQRLDRKYAAAQIAERCPRLLQPFKVWYSRTTTHVWRTAAGDFREIRSSRGVDQGDPIANPVFAVSTAAPAENLKKDLDRCDPKSAVFQFADDVQVVTTTSYFAIVAESTARHWAPAGLSFEVRKDQCWSLDPLPLSDAYWQSKRLDRLRCLGPDLVVDQENDPSTAVAPDFEVSPNGSDLIAASTKVTKMASQLAALNAGGLPLQLAQHLFRVGTNNLTQHILVAKPITTVATGAYDQNLRQAWQTLLGLTITDTAWIRGSLPMRDGGAGFGMIGPRAPAAYLSAWSRTWTYVVRHLGFDTSTELLHADPGLGIELNNAAAAIRPLIPPVFDIPWEHTPTPPKEIRQGTLLRHIWRSTRKNLLDQMQTLAAPARLRSCGGPGAGGFLIAPSDDSTWMQDIAFKVAINRRLGGCLRSAHQGDAPACQHRGRAGVCGAPLDADGFHASICATGGHVIARHDSLSRWLQRWLAQGRAHSIPRLEQVLPEEAGRLDLVFQDAGTTVWVDVAVTSAVTTNQRALQARSRSDGVAARAEESVKRSRYHGRATPFVLEADGRPGTSAKTFIRRYSSTASEGHSISPAHAWICISSILQSGNADIELQAWGPGAISSGRVGFWMP